MSSKESIQTLSMWSMLLTRRIKTGRVYPFDELHCAKADLSHRCFGLRYQGISQTTRRPFEPGRESQDLYMWYVCFLLWITSV